VVAGLRTVYRYWSWLVFIAVIVQVGFAGYGAFYVAHKVDKGTVNQDKFDDGFGLHAGFGYLVVLLMLIAFLIALAGGIRGRRLGRAGALFGLGILQILLAWFGFDQPVIGFFHPVNALVIFALSGSIAWTEWRAGTEPTATTAPAV
jgi:hypothetical protein